MRNFCRFFLPRILFTFFRRRRQKLSFCSSPARARVRSISKTFARPWPTAQTRRPEPCTARTRRCGQGRREKRKRCFFIRIRFCRRFFPLCSQPPLSTFSLSLRHHPPTHKQQNLVEKILRTRIYDTVYWKQHCFGLTAASLLDKAVQLRSVGGGGGSAVSGGAGPPSHFICLVLKLLQLQPDREIVLEYVNNEDHKYVRLLGAFYLRLTARPADVYRTLEPLLKDRRRVRARVSASASSAVGVSTGVNATYALTHVDELIDAMLCTPYLFDVALPRLPPRAALQAAGALTAGLPRESSLREEFERVWEAERPGRERERERRRRIQEGEEEEEEERERRGRRSEERRGEEEGELEGCGGDDGRRDRGRERWRLSPPRSRDRDRDRGGYYQRRRSRSRERDNRDRDRGKRPRRDEEGEIGGGSGGGGKKEGLSVAETNALRASLGLAPLK